MTALRYAYLLLLLLFGTTGLLSQDLVKVTSKRLPDGGFEFYASNPYLYPVQLDVRFPRLINLKSDAKIPFFTVLPAKTGLTRLFTLKPGNDGRYGYSLSYLVYPGDPNSKPDADYVYLLPFRHGTKHKCGQGYFGRFSHSGTYGEYALDFDMKVGTPVLAARGGMVVEIKEDSNIRGLTSAYAKHGNFVLIMHSDGTFGRYLHLKQNGALVNPGERVKAGQLIGYSGNTGWSSGPHLHFQVSRPVRLKLKTMPTIFRTGMTNTGKIRAGYYYYAFHPGGEKFTPVFGREITDARYADYGKTVAKDGNVKIRTETVDDTVILFARNGKATTITMTVEGSGLRNVKSSKPLPHKVKIPPGREIYLFLIRPANPEEEWGYGYRYSYSW